MVLETRGLRKSYSGLEVLKGIDLSVGKGETVVIMGPSGCGKSTLLRCMARITEPDEGDVLFYGTSLIRLNNAQLRAVRRRIGLVFQGHNLISHMNVLENVAVGLIASGTDVREAYDLSMEALRRVGLSNKEKAYPNELSGGERQRVGIARVLVMQPEVILWDEPTASLDPMLSGEIYALMRELTSQKHTAMLVVTHEIFFAVNMADKLLLMEQGIIVEEGIPAQVMSNPVSRVGHVLRNIIQPSLRKHGISRKRFIPMKGAFAKGFKGLGVSENLPS